jgi:hypothetical protein
VLGVINIITRSSKATHGTTVIAAGGTSARGLGSVTTGGTIFLQEMARFNELTDAEKLTGLSREEARRFCEATENVHDLGQFGETMAGFRG